MAKPISFAISLDEAEQKAFQEHNLYATAWKPVSRAVGKLVVVYFKSQKALVAVGRLVGYTFYSSDGTVDTVGSGSDRAPTYVNGQPQAVWNITDVVYLGQPIPHHGGLGLWKLKPPYTEQIETYLEAPVSETNGASNGAGGEEQSSIPWKRKTFFPHDVCGVRDCMQPAGGYMTSVRKKRLWWGPICAKCAVEHTTHQPQSLQSIAVQRKGVEDLASVLDVPVEEVQKRLELAGISATGQPLGVVERAVSDVQQAVSDTTHTSAAALEPQVEIVPPDDPGLERAQAVAIIPKAELAAALKGGEELFSKLQHFQVKDQAGMDFAGHLTRTVKAEYTTFENLRKELVEPINEAHKTVQDAFRPILKLLEKTEAHLKRCMLEGQMRLNAAQDAALQQVQQAYQQGDAHTAALATQHAQAAAVDAPQGVSFRTIIDFVVSDINLVPREFFVLNDAAVKHALAAGLTIPGIQRVDKQIAAVRA